jgi:hypothetical protein
MLYYVALKRFKIMSKATHRELFRTQLIFQRVLLLARALVVFLPVLVLGVLAALFWVAPLVFCLRLAVISPLEEEVRGLIWQALGTLLFDHLVLQGLQQHHS